MKTIKIIDLLNKMANGEELPKLIKWRGVKFYLTNKNDYDDYVNDNGCSLFRHDTEFYTSLDLLNDEVEILDEEDEFEDVEELPHFDFKKFKSMSAEERFYATINEYDVLDKLIKNQKKIIERLNNE